MMKKVYICSPLGGNVEQNIEKAKIYARYVLLCGMVPVVPHFYALCLDDNEKKERAIGMAAGISLLWFCDELWVFGEEITKGMNQEINFCVNLNIKIRYIKQSQIEDEIKPKMLM